MTKESVPKTHTESLDVKSRRVGLAKFPASTLTLSPLTSTRVKVLLPISTPYVGSYRVRSGENSTTVNVVRECSSRTSFYFM